MSMSDADRIILAYRLFFSRRLLWDNVLQKALITVNIH